MIKKKKKKRKHAAFTVCLQSVPLCLSRSAFQHANREVTLFHSLFLSSLLLNKTNPKLTWFSFSPIFFLQFKPNQVVQVTSSFYKFSRYYYYYYHYYIYIQFVCNYHKTSAFGFGFRQLHSTMNDLLSVPSHSSSSAVFIFLCRFIGFLNFLSFVFLNVWTCLEAFQFSFCLDLTADAIGSVV